MISSHEDWDVLEKKLKVNYSLSTNGGKELKTQGLSVQVVVVKKLVTRGRLEGGEQGEKGEKEGHHSSTGGDLEGLRNFQSKPPLYQWESSQKEGKK